MEVGANPTKPRRVMVVADPTRESSAAIQYALSHGVMDRDELILLRVENSGSWRNTLSTLFRRSSLNATATGTGMGTGGGGSGSFHGSSTGRGSFGVSRSTAGGGGTEVDYLEEMKRACEVAQPKVRVTVERVEMDQNDDCKASVILSQCASHGVDVLVIGQRRNFSQAILGYRRPGSSKGTRVTDTAEYLIENCKCTCVGVQKKGQNAGYLLNTKNCRNFWLLA